MSKIILIDTSGLLVPSIMSWESQVIAKQRSFKKDQFIYPAHCLYLISLISSLKKIGVDKDTKIIMALEGKSFRKLIYAPYKAQREEARNEHKLIDWDKEWGNANKLHDQLKEATDWNFVQVFNGLEADDVIAIACRYFKDDEKIVVSGDADLKQLTYYCVDTKTEILTLHGWKYYNEIKIGDTVASFNQNENIIEYTPISYLHINNHKGLMKHIKTKSLDIVCTNNHEFPIKQYKMKSGKLIYEDVKVRADNLKAYDKIFLNAEKYNYSVNYSISEQWAELIGWVISDGHFINKRQKALGISQSYKVNKLKCERIKYLLNKSQINYSISKNKNGMWLFYISRCPFNDWVYKHVEKKELNEFLTKLPYLELKAMFKGLIDGDGTIKKNKKEIAYTYYTINKNTSDWFQILGLKLGFSVYTYITTQNKTPLYCINLTKRQLSGLRHAKITNIDYDGIIWCPTLKRNKNWIARRNGSVYITGNSNTHFYNLFKKCKGSKGMFDLIVDPLAIIADKAKKGDVSDNIIPSPDDEPEDFALRYELVNLLKLPKEIEERGISAIDEELQREKFLDIDLLPKYIQERFPQIFNSKYKITPEYCHKLIEKRIDAKKKKDKAKRDAKKLEMFRELFNNRLLNSVTKKEWNRLKRAELINVIFPEAPKTYEEINQEKEIGNGNKV